MTNVVALQLETTHPHIPSEETFTSWVNKVLEKQAKPVELCIRIVDNAEIAELNQLYRQKEGPTNILSFPYDDIADFDLDMPLLGDIIICAPLIESEALEQEKNIEDHWAHIVVHGVLHLLGYDHQTEADAAAMETLEIDLLKQLGHPDPYGELLQHD